MPRYVYVVEQGCYSNRGVVGVYASPEAAMAAFPEPPQATTSYNRIRPGWWQPCPHSVPGYLWTNGMDWDDAMDITRYELDGE